MPKPCPQCAATLSQTGECTDCGYGRKKPKTPGPIDPDHAWRCAYEIIGQRCNEVGSYKVGEKWMCAIHAGKRSLADTVAAEAGREGLAIAREILAKAKPLPRISGLHHAAQAALPTIEKLRAADAQNKAFQYTAADAEAWQDGRE